MVFFRKWWALVSAPVTLALAAAAWLILVVSGPFNTYGTLDPVERSIFWGVNLAAGTCVAFALKILADRLTGRRRIWQHAGFVASLHAVVFTPILYFWSHWFTGAKREITPYWLIMVILFVIVFLIGLIRYHYDQQREILALPEAKANRPRLMERLTLDQAGALHHVTVEDHYVAVATDIGTERILLRFADALKELDGVAGLQVHRSHWVAVQAVQDVERKAGRVYLRLVDGQRVPVSKAYREAVETIFG